MLAIFIFDTVTSQWPLTSLKLRFRKIISIISISRSLTLYYISVLFFIACDSDLWKTVFTCGL